MSASSRPHDQRYMPLPASERVELSDEAKLALNLADVFYDAAVTDCYVTRALVSAIEHGVAMLSELDFASLITEIDDDMVLERFHQARDAAENRFGPAPASAIYPTSDSVPASQAASAGFGGTEEDLADLRRAGPSADG